MKIAICDDHLESMEQIYIHLTDFLRRRSIVAEILRYASAETFSAAMDEMRFDLAFLAVAWQDYSGFALARKLRSIDVQCELAFVTSHPEFMSDVFPYRPIGYIVKPVSG